MIVDRIRQKCPNLLLEFRLSSTEETEGGMGIDEVVEFCKMLDGKVDIIHVSSATFHDTASAARMFPTVFYPRGCNVDNAARIKAVGQEIPGHRGGRPERPRFHGRDHRRRQGGLRGAGGPPVHRRPQLAQEGLGGQARDHPQVHPVRDLHQRRLHPPRALLLRRAALHRHTHLGPGV